MEELSIHWIPLLPVAVMVAGTILVRRTHRDEPNKKKVAYYMLRYQLLGVALLLLAFGLALPSRPYLGVSAEFLTAAKVTNPDELIKYLQLQNKALLRTIEILNYILMGLVFFAGPLLLGFFRTLSDVDSAVGKNTHAK